VIKRKNLAIVACGMLGVKSVEVLRERMSACAEEREGSPFRNFYIIGKGRAKRITLSPLRIGTKYVERSPLASLVSRQSKRWKGSYYRAKWYRKSVIEFTSCE